MPAAAAPPIVTSVRGSERRKGSCVALSTVDLVVMACVALAFAAVILTVAMNN
jgi:hypothetical protein